MPPRTKKIVIPFNAGMREDIDSKLLPEGLFAAIVNMRYRKDGKLGLRNGYVSLPLDTDGGATLAAYDLHTVGNRVVARGDASAAGFPRQLFELIEASSSTWKETTGYLTASPVATLCAFQDLRHMSGAQNAPGGSTRLQLAACNGFVASVQTFAGVLGASITVRVQRDNGAVIADMVFSATVTRARVCTVATGVGTNRAFVFVAENTGTLRVEAWLFDPNTNTTSGLTALGPLHAADGVIRCFDVAEVVGSSEFVCAVATTTTNRYQIVRFNLSGVQQGATITVAALNCASIAVEAASAAGGTIGTFVRTSAPAYQLRTHTFAGVLAPGPTTLFGTSTPFTTVDDEIRIVRIVNGGAACHACFANVVAPLNAGLQIRIADIACDLRTVAAHASTAFFLFDCLLEGHVVSLYATLVGGAAFGLCMSVTIGDSLVRSAGRTSCLLYLDSLSDQICCHDDLVSLNGECSTSYDVSTGRVWFSSFYQAATGDTFKSPRLTSALVNSTSPIVGAPIASQVVLPGGAPQIWETGYPREIGFSSVPAIRALSQSTGGGALTLLASYDYVATWARLSPQGELERSAPSAVRTITLTGANNQTQHDVSSPRCISGALAAYSVPGAGIMIELWRTVWDPGSGVKIAGFRKCAQATFVGSQGQTATGNGDLMSDAVLAVQELLYTDIGSGALSGPIPRVNAPAARFANTVGSRLQLSGMPDRQRYCESLSKLPGRPVCFAPNARTGASYYSDAQADISGAASTDAGRVLFTEKEILIAGGKGADEDGRGQIPEAVRLSGDFALRASGQRSVLVAKEGVWFQADDEKLCLLPLDGGPARWEGQAIRTTLKSRPAIAAAAQCQNDNTALFAINNAFTGRILVRDQRNGQWMHDSLATVPLVSSMVQQNGTVVLLGSDGVKRYSPTGFADGVSTAITAQLQTNWVSSAGLGGWQQFVSALLSIEWRSDCQVSIFLVRDTAANLVLINTFTLTGLTVGSFIDLECRPKQGKCTRFALLFTVVPTTPGEAVFFNSLTLEVLPFGGPARLPRARRA